MKATFALSSGTPVFIVSANTDALSRVFGGTYLKQYNAWMFPAYPPFLDRVRSDFNALDITYDEKAHEYLTGLLSYDAQLQRVKEEPLLGPHPNYEHQESGIAEILYYYRWALRWEMGTGKTKVIIEALNKLRGKQTLVVAPVVALDNWTEELQVHSGGQLKTIALLGTTRQKKLEVLQKAIDERYDVLLTTYDTARLYGVNSLPSAVDKAVKASRLPIPAVVQKLLRGLPVETSLQLITDYQNMVALPELKRRAAGADRDLCLADFPFEIIVLDESHRIKNSRSKRTKAIQELGKQAPRRYLLTGTMSMGNPLDLHPQLNFLAKYISPENDFEFKKKFCNLSTFNTHIVTGYKNLHIINQRVNSVSSEKRIDDCVDLPELTDIDVMFELTPEQVRDYNSIIKGVELDFGDYGILKNLNGGVRLGKLLQICGGFLYARDEIASTVCDSCQHVVDCVVHSFQPGKKGCKRKAELQGMNERNTLRYARNPKLESLEDLLEDLLADPEEKVVIWANFEAEMEDIAGLLQKLELPYVQVDGSTTHDIKKLAAKFNNEKSCRVYLGQESTGISINLVSARYAVYYSRSWSLEHWLQSRAREYRIGQKRKTVVYRLSASHSVEVQQLVALDNRQDIALMLTEKVSCAICDQYPECLKKHIVPWSSGCVFKSKVQRKTAKPEVLKRWKS